MKTSKKSHIILAAALMAAPVTFADELNQVIEVEKQVEVVEQKADKMPAMPEAMPVVARNINLNFSDWTIPAEIDPSLVTQSPDRYNDGFRFLRKRGYASFGMGNYLNMVGSAGFRIIDKENTLLNVWMQHNSTDGTIDNRTKFATDDRFRLEFGHDFYKGRLGINAGYKLNKFNYYGSLYYSPDTKRQIANNGSLNLSWLSQPTDNGLQYYVDLGYNYFAHGNGLPLSETRPYEFMDEGLTENNILAKVGASLTWNDYSHVGLDAEVQWDKYSNLPVYGQHSDSPEPVIMATNKSLAMFSATPYYAKTTDRMNLRIGARLDISHNNGTVFRIAPDVKFGYIFTDRVSLEASATGGNRLNSYYTLAARNLYASTLMWNTRTFTQLDAEVRLNIGEWGGFRFSPYFGYAIVKDALTPSVIRYMQNDQTFVNHFSDRLGMVRYSGFDRNGLKMGIDMGWKFRELLELKAGYAFMPQEYDSGYALADDRAEHTVSASLKVTPIKPLDIYVDYQLRAGRYVNVTTIFDANPSLLPNAGMENLGNISNLGFGVTYRFFDWLHAYAQGSNLLNRRVYDYYGMLSQRATFLIGVGVSF